MSNGASHSVFYNTVNDAVCYQNPTGGPNVSVDYGWYRTDWIPWQEAHYPDYYVYPYYPTFSESKFDKAFRVAKLLLKKDLLISHKLQDFIQLVEEIAKEL